MKLTYNVSDRPSTGKVLVFAFQQLLAILAATIAVPANIGNGMSQAAALFGAGVGTLVYVLFTKKKSPVFLGSSFAFLKPMGVVFAFEGAAASALGFLGLIIGAVLAGMVYVVLAILVKRFGVKWVSILMPPVVIGPTVAVIGLTLAGNAVSDLTNGGVAFNVHTYLCLLCGLVTLFVTMIASAYGKKMTKMIPFIIGILSGYVLATILTLIGKGAGVEAMKIIDFSKFNDMSWNPVNTVKEFTVYKAFVGGKAIKAFSLEYFTTLVAAYVPVAFVVFAEHLADHKNLSSIIEKDLLEDPGLDRTLLGDGVGSMAGALFGGCPNTTYGESIGCVAISGNASVITIIVTAIMAIVASFISPFVTFLATIPGCVMGGVCFALYGFIAVSGLKMLQKVDLGTDRNLFVASVILIAGIGALTMKIGDNITITEVACALILGILTNAVLGKSDAPKEQNSEEEQ